MQKLSAKQFKQLQYAVLMAACFSVICLYYCMDIPALLQSELVDHYENIYGKEKSEIYFSFLYSFYNIPNIILPLIGGILVDEIGYKITTLLFVGFITVGQLVVSFGMQLNSFPLMIFGRFIFGIGGESISISVQKIIIKWFQGSELSFAFAINLSMLRCASIANTIFTPRIAEFQSLTVSFYFGFLVCLLSLLIVLVMIFLDVKYEDYLPHIVIEKEKEKQNKLKLEQETQRKASEQQGEGQDINNNDENNNIYKKMIQQMSGLVQKTKQNIFKFSQIFWILTVLMLALYMAVLTFNTFSSTIVIDLWLKKLYPENSLEKNQEIAGDLMSIPYIVSSLLFPVFGLICDKYGQRAVLLLLSPILILIAFLFLPFYYPSFSFTLLGISYAIFGSIIWPTVTYLVPQSQIGIAFGAMGSLQNFGMGILPLIIAYIEVTYSSQVVVNCFTLISLMAVLIGVLLNYQNSQCEVSLNDKDQNKLTKQLELLSSRERDLKFDKNKNILLEDDESLQKNLKIAENQEQQNDKVKTDTPIQDDEQEQLLNTEL